MEFGTPMDIQIYLNKMKYNSEEMFKCPANVVKEQSANCTEGALFAATELKKLGYKAFIIVIIADNDDDHLIAAFKRGKYWGAVAKSNTSVLRFRDAVYSSVRELVMSYFDMYFNTKYVKTMRRYSEPIPIDSFESYLSVDDGDYWGIIDGARYFRLLSDEMIKNLEPADPDLFKLCFALSDWNGIYKAE
ncbi:MAG: hypothetical protein NDI94_04690 [Candidatus Woesearchaeota archaeon]|nr:hypothetical protein [Candidatus Woesearchaeota archaeon]